MINEEVEILVHLPSHFGCSLSFRLSGMEQNLGIQPFTKSDDLAMELQPLYLA